MLRYDMGPSLFGFLQDPMRVSSEANFASWERLRAVAFDAEQGVGVAGAGTGGPSRVGSARALRTPASAKSLPSAMSPHHPFGWGS